MQATPVTSSWVQSVEYVPLASTIKALGFTGGWLIVAMMSGSKYAYQVPSWMAGLMMAASKKGRTGRAYGKLLKGKWPSVKIDEGTAKEIGLP